MKLSHLFLSAVCAAAVTSAAHPVFAFTASNDTSVVADFEGRSLDLAESWGDARACIEIAGTVSCYRSEADMDVAHPEFVFDRAQISVAEEAGVTSAPAAAFSGPFVTVLSCSTSLRLYRSTNYTGSVLQLTSRAVTHNMSAFGFDNDVSSYKVGACSSTFWSGSNLSGSIYPGSTDANDVSPSMGGGWDNIVSSVRID